MAKISKEVVATLLEILMDDEVDDAAVKAEKEKREAEAAEKARIEAEAKAKADAEAAAAAAAAGKGSDDGDEGKEDDELAKLRAKALESDIKEGLGKKNLDTEYFNLLSDFLAYDKMKGEDGNADPEKVEKLVSALASIALRQPPTGGDDDHYDPTDQGLGKYLKK